MRYAPSRSFSRRPQLSDTVVRAEQLPDVPFHIFAACAKDGYRKPMPGMWYELERIFKEHHVDIGTLCLQRAPELGRRDASTQTKRQRSLSVMPQGGNTILLRRIESGR